MDTINDRIYFLRIQAGISQQRLADDLNLSRRAISLWETDRRTPDIQSVLLLDRSEEHTSELQSH